MSYHPEDPVTIRIDEERTHIISSALPLGEASCGSVQVSEKFYGNINGPSGLLPPVVRYVTPDYRGFLLEQIPTTAVLKWRDGCAGSAATVHEFTIAIPWTIYALDFDASFKRLYKMHVFCRNSSISTVQDRLYSMPLGNLYEDNRACLNQTMSSLTGLPEDADAASYLRCAVNTFWSAEFNKDLVYLLEDKYLPPSFDKIVIKTKGYADDDDCDDDYDEEACNRGMEILNHWQNLSMEDVLDIEWGLTQDNVSTVDKVMKYLDNRYEDRQRAGGTTTGKDSAKIKLINILKNLTSK